MRIRVLLAGILGAVIAVAGCGTTGGKSSVAPQPHAAPSPSVTTTAPSPSAVARLSYAAIDWIWATSQAPIGTEVLVYY
jgi:hypothetical protein